ncbi:Crp/Fnr family transcriptional regulator [Lentzea sp.]|uniref:Crp/Fnr family transcriptional regulator n=1 Tax=Lentzea sp. TaxID=56099 RepID=UPI002ECFE16E
MRADQSFWGMIDDQDRAALRAAATQVAFESGVVICHQGDDSRNVLLVSRGRVKVSRFALSGEETVLAVRGPGEIIGEFSAIDGRRRSATLTAVDPVIGMVIHALALKRLCATRPEIAWALLKVVVSRQRATGEQQDLRTGPSLFRVGAVLLDLAHRGADDMISTVPLSQSEVAGIAGISRETLARALKTLRQRGIIVTSRTSIKILREDELRKLCGI